MPQRAAALILLVAIHAMPTIAAEATCSRWSAPVTAGQLDIALIQEASGIAVSRRSPRLYHINDGNAPQFLITDMKGGATQVVRVPGFTPLDIEDLALGACGSDTCLYLADIGDNAGRRESVQIAVVKETASFSAEAAPERVIVARFPDGPHDAEAIAIHPSGDLFLATKSRLGRGNPSQLFRLKAAQLAAGGEQAFESLGQVPVATLDGMGSSLRRVVTAMDISPDGKRFVLLFYDTAIEFSVDLQKGLPGTWAAGTTHRKLPTATLVQAEAIAYDRDGRSVFYTTESVGGSEAPLMRQSCAD